MKEGLRKAGRPAAQLQEDEDTACPQASKANSQRQKSPSADSQTEHVILNKGQQKDVKVSLGRLEKGEGGSKQNLHIYDVKSQARA